MNDYKLLFDTIPWTSTATGLRYKVYTRDALRLRLVEFYDGFIENDWCMKGHLGIVLEGRAEVLFKNGRKTGFSKGDIIDIPSGDSDKHKTIISHGGSICVLFFENT